MRTHPLLLEVHARLFLERMAREEGRSLPIAEVSAERWRDLVGGFDLLWLMGAWERSEAAREQALCHEGLLAAYDEALPGWSESDVDGSPYAVRAYRLDGALGAPGDLETLHRRLRAAGLRLILDFVPNHVARDHCWTVEHPDYLVRPPPWWREAHPGDWFEAGGEAFAHGRDPYFPPWTDTVQLNFASPELRAALVGELRQIARVCDGVRCDMAPLAVNEVFENLWGEVAGSPPEGEFWAEAIAAVRAERPDFLFIAEAYWGYEPRLLDLGFDYAYDKPLYDHLLHRDGAAVRAYLQADHTGAAAARFIENHDERRAAAAFGPERSLAAAAIIAALPGLFLVHEGQREGRRRHLPVQVVREPEEAAEPAIEAAYARLLERGVAAPVREGACRLLDVRAGEHLVAALWREREAFVVSLVNYDEQPALAVLDVAGLEAGARLVDRLHEDGRTVFAPEPETLFVELAPWEARQFERR